MSPEICYGNKYTLKCDMWAIGCVLYELILLRQAFYAESVPALVIRIVEGRYEAFEANVREEYELLVACTEQLLSLAPEDRPDTSALLADSKVIKRVKLWEAVSGDIFAQEAQVESSFATAYLETHANAQLQGQRGDVSRPFTMSLSSPCSSLSKISPSCWSSSVSYVEEPIRREELSRFIFEHRRILRWGHGQRKPILDLKLFDKNIKEIDASSSSAEEAETSVHILGLSNDGILYSWGSGEDGRLGHGRTAAFDVRDPLEIKTFTEHSIAISQVSCGNNFSTALSVEGALWIWGDLEALGDVGSLNLLKPELQTRLDKFASPVLTSENLNCDFTNTTEGSRDLQKWPVWAMEAEDRLPANETSNPFRSIRKLSHHFETPLSAKWPAWAKTAAGIIANAEERANPFKTKGVTEVKEEQLPQGKEHAIDDKRKLFRRQRKTRQLPSFASCDTLQSTDETDNDTLDSKKSNQDTRSPEASKPGGNKPGGNTSPGETSEHLETSFVASDANDTDVSSENLVFAPRVVGSLRNRRLAAVSCGSSFITALTSDGELLAWGENDFGQLGQGDDERRDVPSSVCWGEEVVVVKSVSAGAEYVLAVTSTDKVFAWGRGVEGQLGTGEQVFDEPQVQPEPVLLPPDCSVAKAVAGVFHSAAVTANGELYTWGEGTSGQLGTGEKRSSLEPVLVEELGRNGEDEHVVNVACGTFHTLALTHAGTVYSFGKGEGGSLGHSSERDICVPKVIASLSHSSIVEVTTLGFASIAISMARER